MNSYSTSPGNDQIALGYYVVCLIDVLGQKQRLVEWQQLPLDGVYTPDFLRSLKKSLGTVLALQKSFTDFFRAFTSPRAIDPRFDLLTNEQKAQFTRAQECSIHIQQFSDTFVFYSPLRNSSGDLNVGSIYGALAAASMAMLQSLAGKVPLRGAISIGAGAEIDPGNFYGPAHATLHHLESEIAKSPRILVGDDLLQFVKAARGFSNAPMIDRVMAVLANRCRDLVDVDRDGLPIVDFLGEPMKSMMSNSDELLKKLSNRHSNMFSKSALDLRA